MLRIYFGKKGTEYYGPSYFKANYEPDWLKDPLVGRMLEDVDDSAFAGGDLIQSKALGPISPRELSGGIQTLICIYENPGLVFDATSCGSNCAKWLAEIGAVKDVTVALEYFMPFDDVPEVEIFIENTGKVYRDGNEYAMAALNALQEVA